MSRQDPPRVARWLLERWTLGPKRESLVGDLLEQYRRGRSQSWYWRQTLSAIVIGFSREGWRHRGVVVSVLAVGVYLPAIYMWLARPMYWVRRLDDLWYPHLIQSRLSWLVVNPWAYRLQPYLWTQRFTWCALLAAVAWIIGRIYWRERGLAIAVLACTQVCVGLPYFRFALSGWLSEPGNGMWFFNVVWYGSVQFVAIPFCIVLAGLWVSPKDRGQIPTGS